MEFPNLGEHCSEPTCNRLDFLPFKCDACSSIFCTDHVSYESHNCPTAYEKDVQVPVCPLCSKPVPKKRGDPPDVVVGNHIDNECQSDIKPVFTNRCTFKGCKAKEMIPVRCADCHENFCLRHRLPPDHSCAGVQETTRRRRLEALDCKPAARNGDLLRKIQGTISEDEALARALQASMLDDDTTRRRIEVSSGYRDRCRLS